MFITENLTDFEKFILSLPRFKDDNPEKNFKKFTMENTDIDEREWVGRYANETIDLMYVAYSATINYVDALIGSGATFQEIIDHIITQTSHQ